MATLKFRFFILSLVSLSCTSEKGPLTTLFAFPDRFAEVSGIEVAGSGSVWALQDSGNKAELYSLGLDGNLKHTLQVDAPNTDWEALAADENANLYIGDFGNNDNSRKDLVIYKINSSDLQKNSTAPIQKTAFWYPDQTAFPPKKSNRIFDAEAFFVYNNAFYVFSKNRSSKFDGTTTLYKIPNKPGRHAAQKISSFAACDTYKKCAITAADISPDGKTMALLTATKVYLFTNFKGDDFFSGESREIDLGIFSQKEGLCFASDSELYIADEQNGNTGGKLYKLKIN